MEIKVLNHGLLALTEKWGDDLTPARTARTSYRNDGKKYAEDRDKKLMQYLMDHKHSTPFEFCGATFYCVMPIFVARQWVRHRTASINEESLRYVSARKQFYVPDVSRMCKQSTTNKQGSSTEIIECAEELIQSEVELQELCWAEYEKRQNAGLANELARTVLPLSTYTAWYWTANLRNILHFLELRTDPHAQYEIRAYAEAMRLLLEQEFPTTMECWENLRSQPKESNNE